MSNLRLGTLLAAVIGVVLGANPVLATQDHKPTLPKIEPADDGLHKQPWFLESFLDLGEDMQEAASQGKRFAIIWEQRGCPYCKATHDINFTIPRIVNYIKDNFVVLQLNLWGDREVTDFDGEKLPEKELANKYAIRYTPTIQFFPETLDEVKGKGGKEAEVHRLLGFFHPYHFLTTFEYIKTKAYEKEPNLQRFLLAKGREERARGIEIDLMANELPAEP